MTELLTAAQMRAIEAAAIASGEVTGLELMERAGRGVVEAIFEEWPELQASSHRAVVLCGPGNNGGDGFVVARLLKEWGWEVEVFLYGDPSRLPPEARVNYERWCGMAEVAAASDYDRYTLETNPNMQSVFVDALFGTGLKRPFPAELECFYETARNAVVDGYKTVAVDVSSGLCSDSGRILREAEYDEANDHWAIDADLTVTFHKAKLGHFLANGPPQSGALSIKDIGLGKVEREIRQRRHGANLQELVFGACGRTGSKSSMAFTESLRKKFFHHKYTHGHALILSGPPGRGGAARLAARGALRIGAGLVTVGCPPEAIAENAARLDAIMLRPIPDAAALGDLLKDDRINALCLGPGMGVGDESQNHLAAALKIGRTMVLDADALTLLAHAPALIAALHENCILTPHGGEFARLFPDIAEKLSQPATKGPAYSKVDATREAAKRAGCVVLFKGPDTVIADPSGCCSINSAHYDRAAPWLATAGSGDVLAGFITGLLARGFAPMQAAESAAWLHVECARVFGPGLIAEDLPEQLPALFRILGL